ncbi:uncharacterized protein LOC119720149 [Patiria miniata]|uniref:Uncharacterized protein n=1 Tax=Patiria miniata TaxID=46514 RepID=A0A913Z3P2_PATMI|nr:uncharacterized protein LOC119720149 [Patiria miniata]
MKNDRLMAKPVEVVMLFGPPFAGKTAYCKHHLSTSHERISAIDQFKEDPTLGLRQVILKIVALLKQGKSVVIDDENWSRSTRQSYVTSISSKVPNCKFRCIKFNSDGPLSLRWMHQWSLAKSLLNLDETSLNDLAQREARISQWLGEDVAGKRPEFPTAQGGLNLQDVRVRLTAEVDYKFEVPALFIQWEGIVQPNDARTNQCMEGTREVLQTWTSCNPWGRIIIISGRSHSDDSTSRMSSKEIVMDMKQSLMELCQSVPCPIYSTLLPDPNSSSSSFATPPQPGLLAFLQRFHHIHLWHRGSLYLHRTKDHADCAQAAGVKCLKAAAALKSPRLVYQSQCSSRDDVNSILKDIKLIGPSGSGQLRSTPRIPLYSETVASGDDGCFFRESICGRTLGICYKDRETLDKYQELYVETATRITDPGSRMVTRIPDSQATDGQGQIANHADSAVTNTQAAPKSGTQQTTREPPSWMLSQSLKKTKKVDRLMGVESLEDSSLEEPQRKKKSEVPPLPSTVYCLSPAELYETALLILQENERLGDSSQTDLKDSSPSQETQEPRTTTEDASNAGDQSEDSTSAESANEIDMNFEGRAANLLDDIFMVESPAMKPPPRKTKVSKKSRKSAKSPSLWPECYVPDTVTSVPETAGFTAASIAPKESTTASVGESSERQKKEGMKTNRGPDFSFLDEIF